MNNDPTPLQKRIRRALSIPAEWARRRDGETTMEQNERWQKRQDEQISALIATEVQAAKAEALRDAADSVHDNAASPYCLPCHRDDADLLHTIADQIETGDQA